MIFLSASLFKIGELKKMIFINDFWLNCYSIRFPFEIERKCFTNQLTSCLKALGCWNRVYQVRDFTFKSLNYSFKILICLCVSQKFMIGFLCSCVVDTNLVDFGSLVYTCITYKWADYL